MCGAWYEGLSESLLSGLVKSLLSPDDAIECVVHGCNVLNKSGFASPYVLSEHTLVITHLL